MSNQLIMFIGGSCDGEGCNNDLTSKAASIRLSNDLFCNYNKNIRPVMNQSSKTIVKTKLYILNAYMVIIQFKHFLLICPLPLYGRYSIWYMGIQPF